MPMGFDCIILVHMKKLIFVVLFFLAMAMVILSFGELENIWGVLQKVRPAHFLTALLLETGWLFVIGMTFMEIYRLLEMKESGRHMFLVASAANLINVIAPSAGVSGVAVMVDDANRRGHPPGKVTAAGALFLLFDYAAFFALLILGLIVLVRRGNLNAGEITASLILLGIAGSLATLLYIGSRSAERLGGILARMARLVNRLARLFNRKKTYLRETRAYEYANELAEGLAVVRARPRGLLRPLALALLNKSLLVVILMVMFLAFDVEFSSGTVVGGFAIGNLFTIVSPTPAGIGVVEGILPVALSSLRVPWESAVVVTLCFRAVTFWYPLAVGAIAMRVLQRTEPDAHTKETS